MVQCYLSILIFIFTRTVSSQQCQNDLENENVMISLSDQEIVQIPLEDYFKSYKEISLCNYNLQNDIKLIESIELVDRYQFQKPNRLEFLKQYKSSKNRMPNQDCIIIALYTYIQIVKLNKMGKYEFEIFYNYVGDTIQNVQLIDNLIILNLQKQSIIFDMLNENRILKVDDFLGCKLPTITDQLNDIIFSAEKNILKVHTQWLKQNMCYAKSLFVECQNNVQFEQPKQILISIFNLRTYPNNMLFFNTEDLLVSINIDQSNSMICKPYHHITAYDYDIQKKIFVLFYDQKLQYGEYQITFQIDLSEDYIDLFITKSFIIFRVDLQIFLLTKKLQIISTKIFSSKFKILANQLQDQFILVTNNYFYKFLLYDRPFLQINSKQSSNVNFFQSIQNQNIKKNFQFFIESDFNTRLKNLNLNQTKEVSTIIDNRLIQLSQCDEEKIIIQSQEFHQYSKILQTFYYNVKVIDLANFKLFFAFSNSYFYFALIDQQIILSFKKYSIQDEFITNSNCAFQIQRDKVTQILCQQNKCYLTYDIMKNLTQKEIIKLFTEDSEILKVVSDNNHFYLLTTDQILFFTINKFQPSRLEWLDTEKNVKSIFASPKKEDYLFVLNNLYELYIYSISLPFQDLISSIKLDEIPIIDIIIFKDYFLVFQILDDQNICNVYNYKNELKIILQRKLPLFIFSTIYFDDLQADYDKNILYVKGQLKSSNKYVIVAYRIDTRVEDSIQFITSVLDQQSFLLPIKNNIILRFQNKFNFTSIQYNQNKQKTCLITKFYEDEDDNPSIDDDEDSLSDNELDLTLNQEEIYQFSTSSFLSISSAGELLILGLQSIYSKKKSVNDDFIQQF